MKTLPLRIFLALSLGIVIGIVCGQLDGGAAFAEHYLKPFGTMFVTALQFVVVPVVLFSMIGGILSMDDMKKSAPWVGKPWFTFSVPQPSPVSSVLLWRSCFVPQASFPFCVPRKTPHGRARLLSALWIRSWA